MQKNPHFFSSKRKWWPDALLLSLNPCCNCSASNLLPHTFNSSCVYKGSGFFLWLCKSWQQKWELPQFQEVSRKTFTLINPYKVFRLSTIHYTMVEFQPFHVKWKAVLCNRIPAKAPLLFFMDFIFALHNIHSGNELNSVNCDQRQGAPLLLEELKIMWHRSSSAGYFKNRTRCRWNPKSVRPLNAAKALEGSSILLQRRQSSCTVDLLICGGPTRPTLWITVGQWASGPNFPKSHNHDDHTNKWCCLNAYYYVVECFFFFKDRFPFSG